MNADALREAAQEVADQLAGRYDDQWATGPVLLADLDALRAALARTPEPQGEAALLRYGHHDLDCANNRGYGMQDGKPIPPFREPCSCGFEAARLRATASDRGETPS